MNSAHLELLNAAYQSPNPRAFLLHAAEFDNCGITASRVHEFVETIRDVNDTQLRADLHSLHESRRISELPLVQAVHWIYFATQFCHVYGKRIGPDLFLYRLAPIHAYSAHNVPCPYIWIDISTHDYQLSVIKTTFPANQMTSMFRVTMHYPGLQPQMYAFDLRFCSRCTTLQQNTFHLEMNEQDRLVCRLSTAADNYPFDFVAILSVGLMFSQTVLCLRTGRQSVYPTFLHKGV